MRAFRKTLGTLASVVLFGLTLTVPNIATAQLNGFNIKGDVGLSAGTQAPPGIYYGSVFYQYRTDRINDSSGSQINEGGNLMTGMGAPFLSVVSTKKFLGANYGVTMVLPFVNANLESPRFGLNPSIGLSDMYIQPLSLGWHLPKADFNLAYGLYMPTGRYSAGANDNTGLGMWGNEISAGTTLYLDKTKSWQVATSSAVEFHTSKKDSNQEVGTILTLEGGAGRNIVKGLGKAGVVYYSQWKLTHDDLGTAGNFLVHGKNSTAAVGPELTIPLASRSKLFGFMTFRYEWEVYSHTSTQGNALFFSFTFPLRPIKLR